MSNYRTNVTMIDDLPSLDDLEGNSGLSMIPSDNANQINKFIRNGYQPPQESGMHTRQHQKQIQIYEQLPQQQQPQQIQIYEPPPQQQIQLYEHPSQKLPEMQFYEQPKNISHLSCISVAEHASNCIVCSRLYNNDRTGYIIVIILLAIICILLLKRVLNV